MPLWIDKYRPKKIEKLDVNIDQKEMLESMLANSKNNIPHLLIYGPAGSGKKTRAIFIFSKVTFTFRNIFDKFSEWFLRRSFGPYTEML